MKQKVIYYLTMLVSIFSLSACQTTTEHKELTPKVTEVAILMPMQGENAHLGEQYSSLIKMGLQDGLSSYVNVTSYDASNEAQALKAMDKIISKNTKIILGPLNSPITEAIANKAIQQGIIIITMSNNPVLAREKIFVFGHAPLKQTERIINYFLDNDYKNFIVLLPVGQHAKNISSIIQDMTISKNATLVRREFYTEQPEQIAKSIQLISDSVDNLNELDDIETKPVVYLGDDAKNLQLLLSSCKKYNLDEKAVLIGDNRIDIEYPEGINLYFTGSLAIQNSNVAERARDLGINHMSFLHNIAYDLGRMTAYYIGPEFNEERFLLKLKSKEPYLGLSGKITFLDSIAQRNYDIIKRQGNEYLTIDQSNNNI